MNDGAMLLRAILDEPAEDSVRLVYADYLEESGSPRRAAFIRAQVAYPLVFVEGTPPDVYADCDEPTMRQLTGLPAFNSVRADTERHRIAKPTYRRGFVAELAITCDDLMNCAAAVFAHHPVERVVITDKHPWVGQFSATDTAPNLWGWWRAWSPTLNAVSESDPDTLPHELMAILSRHPKKLAPAGHRYDSHLKMGAVMFAHPEAATEALSDACIAIGRERAGLVAPLAVAGGGLAAFRDGALNHLQRLGERVALRAALVGVAAVAVVKPAPRLA